MRAALLIFAMAAPCLAPAVSYAQDGAIVVTGERRGVAIDSQVQAIATLNADTIATVGAQHPSELLNRAPGVNIHRGSGIESLPAIRSPVLTGGQGAGEILILEDGVPIRAPGFANINEAYEADFEFAKRVEVTRGPGSALYGSNAVHGLINVITDMPADTGDSLTVEGGSFGRLRGDLSAGIGKHIRVNRSAIHEDGWRDAAGLDMQKALTSGGITLGGWDIVARLATINLNQETAGFVTGTNAYKDPAVRRANANPEGFRDSDIIRLNADITRSFGPFSVKLTPYGRDVYTRVLLHFFPSKAIETTGQAGGGFQSALYWDPSEKFSGIVGVDYDHTRGFLREVQTLPTQPGNYVQGLHYDYVVDADVVAGYAQARYAFLPEWSVTAGVREEHTVYDYTNNAPSNDFGRYRRTADRADEFDAFTPKLGLLKQFESGGSAYFNYARGARAPQTTDLYELQTLQTPGNQPTQTIDSFELGLRKPVLGGRIEVSVYSMNKQHESLRNAGGFSINNAKTRHQGVEVSADMPVGKYFTVMGWATYAEHTYRYADPSAIAGETITAGNEIDTAPRRLANVRVQWKPITKVSTELEWDHVGRYFTNAANTRIYPGHDVFNLRADLNVSDRFSVFGAVRNLTDLKYAERADYAVVANVGTDRYFPAEDRAFSIGVRATR